VRRAPTDEAGVVKAQDKGRRGPGRVRALAAAYLVGIVLVWLLTRAIAEGQWWTTVLLYGPQAVYLLPLLLTLPLALRPRDRPALALNAAAALLVLGPMMGFNAPLPPPQSRPGAPRARVLAWNITAPGVGRLEPVLEAVRRHRSDLVVFCEARRDPDDPKSIGLQKELRTTFSTGEFAGWHSVGSAEVFLASRWPLTAESIEALPHSVNRDKVRARVEAPWGSFWLAGVHFSKSFQPQTIPRQRTRLPRYLERSYRGRTLQMQDVLAWTDVDEPLILAGDFNTPPAGRHYDLFARRYEDAFPQAGWGWGLTYPAAFPLVRIDYLWHTREWRTVGFRTDRSAISDHRSLVVDLEWVGDRAAR